MSSEVEPDTNNELLLNYCEFIVTKVSIGKIYQHSDKKSLKVLPSMLITKLLRVPTLVAESLLKCL